MGTIDLSKVTHELERMNSGEIPFNLGYLEELVEHDGDIENVSFSIACAECADLLIFVPCPECALAKTDKCSFCQGVGGWFECENCDLTND